ncbi:MAG: PilT/PilU family type 4a pilus ATPase [Deltaproteobacteria bacterium]|nr:PilT/PilU family type 4a pilus ATPase [Deltaproteobacteria bacterium]
MSFDADAQDGLFGRLAVHQRLITMEQLQRATAEQSMATTRRPLPTILIELGFLSTAQHDELLLHQQTVLSRRAKDDAERAAAAALPAAVPSAPARAFARSETLSLSIDVVEELQAALKKGIPVQADPEREAREWLVTVLTAAVSQQASDIHVHAGDPLRIRRFGVLHTVSEHPLPPALTSMAVTSLLPELERAKLQAVGHVDCALTVPGVGRFRVVVYRQQRGTDGVFRCVKARPPTLAELSLPPSLARLTTFHQGIVLCTGPSACGKSSTLAALLHMINEERAEHVVTIEDPIEVLHPPIRCVVNQRQAGRHTSSFGRALRAALREDPDVIVIGEMRDRETAQLALTAAETGHLVLATIHTHSAVRTINRVIGEFSPLQQPGIRAMLAESLRAIVSQRLLPRKDGNGVVPAVEVLMSTPAVANLIRDSRVHQIRSAMQTGAGLGMQTLDAALQDLVIRGVVDEDVARRHAEDPRSIGSDPFAAKATNPFMSVPRSSP